MNYEGALSNYEGDLGPSWLEAGWEPFRQEKKDPLSEYGGSIIITTLSHY